MSSKTKTTPTKEAATPALVPKLRFPEFRGAKGWEDTPLQKIARPVADRAVTGDGDNILSLSGEHGLVLQSDYFGKKVAGDSAERYLKLVRNDFVYNDRTTKASTFGTIKRLSNYEGGIVSPIYKCFRFHGDENPVFWEWYFESGNHDAALRGLVNEGARAGRFNISITQFLTTAAPRPDEAEQQKIAECLSSVDELMAAQARKVDALKTHKKGLMQQLFPREGETQPRLRFPEFQNAGEWVVKPLGEVFPITSSKRVHESDWTPTGVPFYRAREIVALNKREPIQPLFISEELYAAYCKQTGEIREGHLLVTGVGSIGVPYLVKAGDRFYFKDGNIIWLKNDGKELSGEFLLRLYETNYVQKQLKAMADVGTVATYTIDNAKRTLAAFPKEEDEQQRIATCLSSLDALITAEIQKHEALKTHKKGLMQQLFPSPEEVQA